MLRLEILSYLEEIRGNEDEERYQGNLTSPGPFPLPTGYR